MGILQTMCFNREIQREGFFDTAEMPTLVMI